MREKEGLLRSASTYLHNLGNTISETKDYRKGAYYRLVSRNLLYSIYKIRMIKQTEGS